MADSPAQGLLILNSSVTLFKTGAGRAYSFCLLWQHYPHFAACWARLAHGHWVQRTYRQTCTLCMRVLEWEGGFRGRGYLHADLKGWFQVAVLGRSDLDNQFFRASEERTDCTWHTVYAVVLGRTVLMQKWIRLQINDLMMFRNAPSPVKNFPGR